MGSFLCLWGQVLGSLSQSSVICLEGNSVLGHDLLVQLLLELLLLLSSFLLILPCDWDFVHEDSVRILYASWEAIQNEALVLAGSTIQLYFDKIMKNIVS